MVSMLCALPAEANVLLRTEIPQPFYFIEQFKNYNIPNLESRETEYRKQVLYVPPGTTNLALQKPVSASGPATVGDLALVTDGNKSGDDGAWLELGPGVQWVQIDLQQEAEIQAVWLWHFFKRERVYFAVIAAISNDPEFKKDVKIVFNNDTNNVVGLGKGAAPNYFDKYCGRLIDAKGIKGRYVRLYSNGNNENKMNHYVEVEVFGLKSGGAVSKKDQPITHMSSKKGATVKGSKLGPF